MANTEAFFSQTLAERDPELLPPSLKSKNVKKLVLN